jgi:hypothetical protein
MSRWKIENYGGPWQRRACVRIGSLRKASGKELGEEEIEREINQVRTVRQRHKTK